MLELLIPTLSNISRPLRPSRRFALQRVRLATASLKQLRTTRCRTTWPRSHPGNEEHSLPFPSPRRTTHCVSAVLAGKRNRPACCHSRATLISTRWASPANSTVSAAGVPVPLMPEHTRTPPALLRASSMSPSRHLLIRFRILRMTAVTYWRLPTLWQQQVLLVVRTRFQRPRLVVIPCSPASAARFVIRARSLLLLQAR